MFDAAGNFRPVYFFSPDLPEGRSQLGPSDRWLTSLELLWQWVPESDHPRVMLPTVAGLTQEENNYADNPFLLRLNQLGYKGAFWSHWLQREQLMQSATTTVAEAPSIGSARSHRLVITYCDACPGL